MQEPVPAARPPASRRIPVAAFPFPAPGRAPEPPNPGSPLVPVPGTRRAFPRQRQPERTPAAYPESRRPPPWRLGPFAAPCFSYARHTTPRRRPVAGSPELRRGIARLHSLPAAPESSLELPVAGRPSPAQTAGPPPARAERPAVEQPAAPRFALQLPGVVAALASGRLGRTSDRSGGSPRWHLRI